MHSLIEWVVVPFVMAVLAEIFLGVTKRQGRQLPFRIARVARRMLPEELRDLVYEADWSVELLTILRDLPCGPVRRYWEALKYSCGLLVASRRVAREMGVLPPSVSSLLLHFGPSKWVMRGLVSYVTTWAENEKESFLNQFYWELYWQLEAYLNGPVPLREPLSAVPRFDVTVGVRELQAALDASPSKPEGKKEPFRWRLCRRLGITDPVTRAFSARASRRVLIFEALNDAMDVRHREPF
jgi:hypothetical protein